MGEAAGRGLVAIPWSLAPLLHAPNGLRDLCVWGVGVGVRQSLGTHLALSRAVPKDSVRFSFLSPGSCIPGRPYL